MKRNGSSKTIVSTARQRRPSSLQSLHLSTTLRLILGAMVLICLVNYWIVHQLPKEPVKPSVIPPQLKSTSHGSSLNRPKPRRSQQQQRRRVLGYASSTYTPPVLAKTGSPSAVECLSQTLNRTSTQILPLAEPLVSSPTTIVTAYFDVPSKYHSAEYDTWMKNSLSLQDAMVIFTSPDKVDQIRQLRQHALDKTVIVVQSLTDLPIHRLHTDTHPDFWQHQLELDREQRIHQSYELFWIWLSKTWWMVQAIHLDFFHSDYYMWTDIGCFRNKKYNGVQLVQHTEILPDHDTLLFMAHHPPNPPLRQLWNDKFTERNHFFHSGSQAFGHVHAWPAFLQSFSETMDEWLAHDLFVGEDQCVLQMTCQSHSAQCAYVPFDQVNDNHYFGLRHVLHHGDPDNEIRLWRANNETTA